MDNPFGGALPTDGNSIMRMLPMLFSQAIKGYQQGANPQQQPQQQQSQPQPQQPNMGMFSGLAPAMDPNKGFMQGLMGKINPNGGGAQPPQIGAPITNTPSTNMQNNPFMQMPQINGGMR